VAREPQVADPWPRLSTTIRRTNGKTFNTKDKEHIHDIRGNNGNTGYSDHILNTGHTYGTITDTMEIITTGIKGRYLNTLEKYHIYISYLAKLYEGCPQNKILNEFSQ
jgi:hypothetical protein